MHLREWPLVEDRSIEGPCRWASFRGRTETHLRWPDEGGDRAQGSQRKWGGDISC